MFTGFLTVRPDTLACEQKRIGASSGEVCAPAARDGSPVARVPNCSAVWRAAQGPQRPSPTDRKWTAATIALFLIATIDGLQLRRLATGDEHLAIADPLRQQSSAPLSPDVG